MAKIQKIELNLSQKIANPFKTTRKSTTNPFKYNDFEGNTLDVAAFADVFEGAGKNSNKLKLISSSVIGSITKLRNSITEPIVNFVNRIGTRISSAWDYAKNKNIEIAGLDTLSENIHNILSYDVGKGILDSIHGLNNHISERLSSVSKGISGSISFLNKDVTEVGKDIADSLSSLIGGIHHNHITSDTSVAELKSMWIKENELMAAKEISINSSSSSKVRVA